MNSLVWMVCEVKLCPNAFFSDYLPHRIRVLRLVCGHSVFHWVKEVTKSSASNQSNRCRSYFCFVISVQEPIVWVVRDTGVGSKDNVMIQVEAHNE